MFDINFIRFQINCIHLRGNKKFNVQVHIMADGYNDTGFDDFPNFDQLKSFFGRSSHEKNGPKSWHEKIWIDFRLLYGG